MIAAVGANVALFALWQLERRGGGPRWLARALQTHTLCSRAHLRQGRVHTLLTSAVSHQGTLHFAINTYGLCLFGGLAAETLSTPELGVLLAASGAGSSAMHALCHPRNPVLGASGVLMGLVTADGLLEPEKQFHMILPVPGLTLSMLQVSDLAFASNLLGFLLLRRWLGTVAWTAHLGGTAVGLGYSCGAWCGGDERFGHPVRFHTELCMRDWTRTAESVEVGLAGAAAAVERWRSAR